VGYNKSILNDRADDDVTLMSCLVETTPPNVFDSLQNDTVPRHHGDLLAWNVSVTTELKPAAQLR